MQQFNFIYFKTLIGILYLIYITHKQLDCVVKHHSLPYRYRVLNSNFYGLFNNLKLQTSAGYRFEVIRCCQNYTIPTPIL